MVKCRPPGNRVPGKDEIEACKTFLEAQIEFVKPKSDRISWIDHAVHGHLEASGSDKPYQRQNGLTSKTMLK